MLDLISATERFYQSTMPVTECGCLLWTGGMNPRSGYGQFSGITQHPIYRQNAAHRWIWIATHGPLPTTTLVCHRCDVRLCVNLDHLFTGSTWDNAQDAKRKGRHTHGETTFAKLSESDVRRILMCGLPVYVLAAEYNVSSWTILDIRARRTWTHIDLPRDERRRRPGDRNARRLTPEIVLAIRNCDTPTAQLARQYKVSDSTIADVRHRRTWKHI